MTLAQDASRQARVALVTGGNRGIGLAIARRLAAEGYAILLWGRDAERNAAAAAALPCAPGRVATFACDVTSDTQVAEAVAQGVERMGGIDACFVNAGASASTPNPIDRLDLDMWRHVMRSNVEGAVITAKHVSAAMKQGQRGGSLVFMSSTAARTGIPLRAAYPMSKAAIEALMRSLAVELAGDGIRANAIAPGFVESDMTRRAGDALADYFRARIPSGRLGQPDDIVGLAAFLAGDESRYVTGQVLTADGGYSIS